MNRLIPCGVCVLLAGIAVAQDRTEWKEVASEKGKYKILFPKETKHQSGKFGPLELYADGTAVDGTVYMVGYQPLPDSPVKMEVPKDLEYLLDPKMEPKARFAGAKVGLMARQNAKLVREKNVKVGKVEGREFVVNYERRPGESRTLRNQVFVVGKMFYSIFVDAAKAETVDHRDHGAKFFDSLKFTAETK